MFLSGLGLGVGDGVGEGEGVGVGEGEGVGVGGTTPVLKVAMQPAQEVDIKYVPEFAVSLVVETLTNSASDKYVPKLVACPLDNA